MAGIAATAAIIILNILGNGLNFPLLAIGPSELQAAHLKRAQAIAQLNYMNQTVQVVRSQNLLLRHKHINEWHLKRNKNAHRNSRPD